MSDPDIQAEGVPTGTPEAPAETPAAGSQPVEQTAPPATEGQPAEAPKDTPPPAAGEPAKPQEPAQTDSKPSSRRSASFRIQQVITERDDWKTKYEELARKGQPNDSGEGDPLPNDNQPQPNISKQVETEAKRYLEPVLSHQRQQADDGEISELFSGANAGKRSLYEPRIREAWKQDQYKDMAASDLLKLFSYDADIAAAKAAGVEEHKRAEKEAKESSGSGTSARPAAKSESAWDKSDEEFQKTQDEVRQMAG